MTLLTRTETARPISQAVRCPRPVQFRNWVRPADLKGVLEVGLTQSYT